MSLRDPDPEIDMTTIEKIARRKLSLLQLAQDLANVSRACKVMGYSRQQFYEIRRNFQTYGAEGLIDRLPGAKGPHANRVSAEIEQGSSTMPWCIPVTGRPGAGPTSILTSCSCSSRTSSTSPPGSSARSRTASSSACTAPCSTSSSLNSHRRCV
jgi:winged helix-turn helix protein